MKTPSAELTARLIEASGELLRLDGVPRFEEVAELVGVSRATLYYYFSGQDDLLSFLLTAHVEEGATAMASADPGDGPAAERLRRMLAAAVTYLAERPAVCSGLLAAASSAGDIRGVLAVNDAHIAGPLREQVAAGAAEGVLAATDPADATNAALGAILLAVLGRASDGRDPTDPGFRDAVVDQVVRGLSSG